MNDSLRLLSGSLLRKDGTGPKKALPKIAVKGDRQHESAQEALLDSCISQQESSAFIARLTRYSPLPMGACLFSQNLWFQFERFLSLAYSLLDKL